jgi:hypothetical protein
MFRHPLLSRAVLVMTFAFGGTALLHVGGHKTAERWVQSGRHGGGC